MDIKIGIIGPGSIANRFASAVPYCNGIKLCAVASRDLQRSQAFAEKYGIEKAYGSYEQMYNDKDIDAVYISTLHSVHYNQIIDALNAGKAVICEKPSLLTVKEADEVIALAKKKNLLFMEAMWTRLLPPIIQAKKWVDEGKIGNLKLISASFAGVCNEDPDSRAFAPEKAGGALYDVGVYPLSFAMYIAGTPIKEYKTMITKAFTGVDETHVGIIRFENEVLAQISSSIRTSTDDNAYINGDKGTIVIRKFWGTTRATLQTADDNEDVVFDSGYDQIYEGFKYEIQHFADLLHEGKTESPIITYDYVKTCVKFFEDSLAELKD